VYNKHTLKADNVQKKIKHHSSY